MRVGIDVGGTFTDVFLHDSATSSYWLAKTPSTPQNQAEGVINGLLDVCEKAGIAPSSLVAVLHGTTVATNALLEGKGARVGLLTTRGWRNILHLADSWTPGPLFGFFSYQAPEPVVPYERIREVDERITADGTVITALEDEQVAEQVRSLLAEGIESLTVSLLHAYAHPGHEQRVAAVARRVFQDSGVSIPLSMSSEVSPEFREYERTVTAVMNSFLGPVMHRYLSALSLALAAVPVSASLQVVRSDGGLMSAQAASELPVQTALSGPSGGVSGAAFVSLRAGYGRIITFDMGGTSTDVAVCVDGIPAVTRETRVASFPVRAPAVDVETIGAGGGSIADVSALTGGLRVGPQSAGAIPGPACYGRGGTLPTVTDANVVLGHLPVALLGGAMKLDVDAAYEAVSSIADAMGTDVHRAAQAIVDIVNGNMLGALRVATVQKGLNPREFALTSFGGAGGLHGNAVAAAMGCYPVIVPAEPGVLSALGFVVADVRNEFSRPFLHSVDDLATGDLRLALKELADQARDWLAGERVAVSDRSVRHVFDMRYRRQGHEIAVEVDETTAQQISPADLAQLFDHEHARVYGFALPASAEIVTIRARAIGRTEKALPDPAPIGGTDAAAAVVGTLESWDGQALVEVRLYERSLLKPGMVFAGKAVVQQYDSTTVVLSGHSARVDAWLNLIIEASK